ncbi:MAG: bifunctional metallophosphatase/5'-nucleotidase [Prevotella sp.]|nr:bifunctional metallophosphatase/5'-nucleotidase [Prevotella sp.]
MKSRWLMIVFLFFICQLSFSTMGAQKQLVILHTGDMHSTILPISSQLPNTLKAGRAGTIRRIEMLRKERQKCSDLLLFDTGDFFQGSAYYTMFKGDVEVGMMNLMGYDAATVGNHEFDFGLEEMARVFRMANFPIVCTNYDFTGTPVEGLVKPYIIIKRNGVKIGVFGVGQQLEGLVSEKNCPGVKFLDPAKVALETATMLKKEKKCDVVICLSHLGWKIGGYDDQYLIHNSRNIDLVLSGHSHTYLVDDRYETDLDGKQVLVDHEGKHAIFVGKMVVNLKR